jgi:hypothetical protein
MAIIYDHDDTIGGMRDWGIYNGVHEGLGHVLHLE